VGLGIADCQFLIADWRVNELCALCEPWILARSVNNRHFSYSKSAIGNRKLAINNGARRRLCPNHG
jgi:hypothetical protein